MAKRDRQAKPAVRAPRPGPRGWPGAGGGMAAYVDVPTEYRGTTVQVCGLWPFGSSAGSPVIGVPLGRSLTGGGTVCADPISWFQRGNLISNPSVFVLGLPGLGKSTLIAKMVIGLAGFGQLPLILADLKPDYIDVIRALGGDVIRFGRGMGHMNILDPGEAAAVAELLPPEQREQVLSDARSRTVEMLAAFYSIVTKRPMGVKERNVIGAAVSMLDRHDDVPVLRDLRELIRTGPEELRLVAGTEGGASYGAVIDELDSALLAMMRPDGPISDVFAGQTSVSMKRDRPTVYDVSSIKDTESDLQAAALLACWSNGFAAVNYHHLLADAGLEDRRHHFLVMDELWRALRAGPQMVDRIDGLTRLNRQWGVGQAMCTHTMNDLAALPEEDRVKAFGFVERSGMVITGGLPEREMPLLAQAGRPFTTAERRMVTSWSAPAAFDVRSNKEGEPPGRGLFLIKVGSRPGIPLKVVLTDAERSLANSNRRWQRQVPKES